MQVLEGARVPIKAWVDGVEFEDEAKAQVRNVASLPFVFKHVAVMPDVHWGMGATVGSVIATTKAVVPAAVGVDIGCGMIAQRTSLAANDLPDSLAEIRAGIERAVPHGRTDRGGKNDRGAWGSTPAVVEERFAPLVPRLREIEEAHPSLRHAGTLAQLGTLGTGNHFIEVCLDEEDRVWVMLHSGSRGIGNRIGTYFIELAKRDMAKWFIDLPDRDLAYFPEGTDHFREYVRAVHWAQEYAQLNRDIMLRNVVDALRPHVKPFDLEETAINCHHNYVAFENHFGKNVLITRKGAVRAREGELGIIPGSMGARSYIVSGKGNAESFESCSHGAGRRLSRTAAKKQFTLEDHAAATAGIECRKDADVLDETPGAYKSIDGVLAAESDLVDVVHTLRQIIVVKG